MGRIFKQTGFKSGRIASAQGGSLVGVQQVLELILEEQVKQTALLEQIANPAIATWVDRSVPSWAASVAGSPPPNS